MNCTTSCMKSIPGRSRHKGIITANRVRAQPLGFGMDHDVNGIRLLYGNRSAMVSLAVLLLET